MTPLARPLSCGNAQQSTRLFPKIYLKSKTNCTRLLELKPHLQQLSAHLVKTGLLVSVHTSTDTMLGFQLLIGDQDPQIKDLFKI